MDKTEAGAVIARVRDLHAHRLLLLVPAASSRHGANGPWQEGDLIAYGMHRVGTYGEDKNQYALYEFDINNYKTTSDWLDSKYWAHPELWNKHRW